MKEKKKFMAIARNILEKSQKDKLEYFIDVEGKRFKVLNGVFSPKYFDDVKFFIDNLDISKNSEILEIGTGIGIFAIFMIYKGANKVVATDINPLAVKNAEINVKLHNLQDKIKVLESDVFDLIKVEKFDLIFWNMPFGYIENEEIPLIERSIFDPKYKSISKFFREVKNYIKQDGKILFGFSTTFGTMSEIKKIINKNQLEIRLIKEIMTKRNNQKIKLQLFEILI